MPSKQSSGNKMLISSLQEQLGLGTEDIKTVWLG